MKLKCIKLRNFRCFNTEVIVDFNDLTAFIGANDAGKSTIMELLDIFFNDGMPDKHDACKSGVVTDVAIVAVFSDLPDRLILDQVAETTLQDEYLLNAQGDLEIHKIFNCDLEKPKLSALKLFANHPTDPQLANLISLNNSDLRSLFTSLGVDPSGVDKRINYGLRKAIRDHIGTLQLQDRFVSLLEGNGIQIWKGIQAELPVFALFKSDRASTDQDSEAQDPLQTAIKEAVRQKETELNAIAKHIDDEVRKIANLTLKKLQEMDPTLASSLTPNFASPKWSSIFKVSITGDEDIPINKRGSGVRRMILLNFFRAKAEQIMVSSNKNNAIYAIEEPETSQHPRNQRLLMSALQSLSGSDQVILTTHTPVLARALPEKDLRFIDVLADGTRAVFIGGTTIVNQRIATSLGVLADHTVKLFVGVEGKHDISALKIIGQILSDSGENVPNLEALELNGEVIFIPQGGSALALWSNRLQNLNRPEFHLYDRDNPPPMPAAYQQSIDQINTRNNCGAHSTNKREMENYIHSDAINLALAEIGLHAAFPLTQDFDDVPTALRDYVNQTVPQSNKWSGSRAKDFICNAAARKMSKPMLDAIDPQQEVLGWFRHMRQMISTVQ